MNIIKLLEYLEEILDTSSKFPLSNKVVVNKKEMLDIISQIMNELPEEFKKAQWIITEKEKILNDAIKDSNAIREQNLKSIQEEVENHDITREAQEKAQNIINAAKDEANDIKIASVEYAYKLLTEVDKQIDIRRNEAIKRVKFDMEQFAMDIQNDFTGVREIISENVDELKKLK
ncbi:hypothetical protein [Clostridium hydrogenum]|uniref:hypothetical protein n=1 Tax=Clostridium hydrogenum TaxID=2855764 RepID=UPI001F2C5DA5|nr:hypothetical protein [Clostridium hydrogenum]